MCDVLCWITQLESYSTHTQTLRYFGFFFSMHIYKVELHSDALRLCFVSFCFVLFRDLSKAHHYYVQ